MGTSKANKKQNASEQNNTETSVVTETKTTTKKTPKKYAPTDFIVCRSVTGGELILVGDKTKMHYNWADFGDTAYVEYQDLQALQSRKSGFLTKPRFIIEDDDLVEQWSSMLKPIYDKINMKNIEELFNLPANQFEAQLNVVPAGLKDAIKTRAVQMIQNDELYDIRKVRAIDTAWGTDFVAMFMK